ncbi:SOS response-associated peptidase family protein, partial [Pseudomonas aeruginosa]|uniref:SOS response-associated peptidase family protein n=1 Tax=Pseudomonas aeruginosa TaxID=287 RepID=UPI003CC67C82
WMITPANQVVMVRVVAGARRAELARWGQTPAWLTDQSRTPSHARAETLAEQTMFRQAFQQSRCLLPANGFYDWRGVRK